ncbi:hypothetical protein ES705_19642 [subsurface metagenome]
MTLKGNLIAGRIDVEADCVRRMLKYNRKKSINIVKIYVDKTIRCLMFLGNFDIIPFIDMCFSLLTPIEAPINTNHTKASFPASSVQGNGDRNKYRKITSRAINITMRNIKKVIVMSSIFERQKYNFFNILIIY